MITTCELDLDLSDVLFLTTANVLDTIPGPLLDRMELVQLDGYTEDEKVAIAKHHLFPRQREKAGLREDELEVTDEALHTLVEGWTREAGVRNLERQLGKVVRKAARKVAAGETATVVVDTDTLNDYVAGRASTRRTRPGRRFPVWRPGSRSTGAGGDVLTIEVTAMDGEPGLQVTGQLGDVMSESAQIALSFVRANAAELDVPEGAFDHRRFHLHVPSGAVPKDGPSAGITMTTALASLVTGRPVKAGVGMTGEVTLQGRVLPIGGLKQKVLARASCRPHRRDPADRQRARPRRRARGGPRGNAVPPRAQRARGVGAGTDVTDLPHGRGTSVRGRGRSARRQSRDRHRRGRRDRARRVRTLRA